MKEEYPNDKETHVGKPRTYNPRCKCDNCEWAADMLREQNKERENENA